MTSALRPDKGLAVTIGGVEFHFLFTFAVLDDLQTYYKEPISEIIRKLTDDMTIYSAAGRIIEALIASDVYNNGGKDVTPPSYQDIMHVLDLDDSRRIVSALLKSYGIDMPEPDEDDDEENEPEPINIARLLIIGKTELGMTEEEFWKTTPRKYFMLFDEYVKLKGGGSRDEGGIDDLP